MTGQDRFGSYEESGAHVAVELVNELPSSSPSVGRWGRSSRSRPSGGSRDRPTFGRAARDRDVPGFVALAGRLKSVFGQLERGDLDAAAGGINDLLAAHSAQPHLAKEDGQWRLHHHPVDATSSRWRLPSAPRASLG